MYVCMYVCMYIYMMMMMMMIKIIINTVELSFKLNATRTIPSLMSRYTIMIILYSFGSANFSRLLRSCVPEILNIGT